jgi:ankyrin repeat protein
MTGRAEDLPQALVGEFIDAVVGDPKKAEALLAQHPGLLNARWTHHETVLHFLAIEGFADGVTFLASRGADVNAVNEFGDSPLVDVVGLALEDIAGTLLRHGANPNADSPTRDNALHTAARTGNARLVALLLAAGADGRYRTDLEESVFDAVDEAPDQQEAILAVLAEYGIVRDADPSA